MQTPAQSYPKPLNNMTNIVVVSLLSNLNRSHANCNATSVYLEQKFLCRVDVQLVFKNKIKRRNKKVYTKCKSEKITEADSAPRNRS